jgi:hypothetical protein
MLLMGDVTTSRRLFTFSKVDECYGDFATTVARSGKRGALFTPKHQPDRLAQC